ncbi:MAG: universal stress protein [Gemmatimonadota bacterium]
MFQRILVAIDFSDPSVEALEWVTRRFPEARITLFHAIEIVRPGSYLREALGEILDPVAENELDVRSNLEHLAREYGIEPRISISSGWPPREVHRAAADEDANLIVLGAHVRRMWPGDPPGTMANKIVEGADRQVLVWRRVPKLADPGDRKVLAALDLREGSGPVAETAVHFARYFGANLLLLHVMTSALQAYLRAVSTPTKTQETLRQLEGIARQELLEQLPETCRDETDVRPIVLRGRPFTQIIAAAESESANVIVLGRGHSPNLPERALLGRVTEKVLRGANCSVLVVPL